MVHFLLTGYLFAWVLVGRRPGAAEVGAVAAAAHPLRHDLLPRVLRGRPDDRHDACWRRTSSSSCTSRGWPTRWPTSARPAPSPGAIGRGARPCCSPCWSPWRGPHRRAETRRQDRQADRDGDAELAAYNARLRRAGRRRRRTSSPTSLHAGELTMRIALIQLGLRRRRVRRRPHRPRRRPRAGPGRATTSSCCPSCGRPAGSTTGLGASGPSPSTGRRAGAGGRRARRRRRRCTPARSSSGRRRRARPGGQGPVEHLAGLLAGRRARRDLPQDPPVRLRRRASRR